MKVPFLDLKAQYASIKNDVSEAIRQVMENTAFAGGPFVKEFEEKYAEYCQVNHALGVGSGTDALWLALKAYNISAGDEVITVPNTFIATAEAISLTGATPVFVDVDSQTYTMDPALLEAAISSKTKAIIPVHLFGQTADMDLILDIAHKSGLPVIEDAAQAHGAEYKGKRAGSLADAGCFSFYPGKNLGAYGEAGAVTCDKQEIAEKVKMLRDHGQYKKYYHSEIGWNMRMDGFQGATLNIKLKHIEDWTEKRRTNARLYQQLLEDVNEVTTPFEADYAKHVYHVYSIRCAKRDALMKHLNDNGIACGIHYPIPIHLQDAYRSLNYQHGVFPISEKIAEELVSLPMYPELENWQIEYVVEEIKSFLTIK